MHLHGIHHITAVTGDVNINLSFYTRILGLRLVKKTVNQDDTSAYHLFYADKLGSPGTDMTFFDWPQTGKNHPGSDSISNSLFRVNGSDALGYWKARFDSLGIKHSDIVTFNSRQMLSFEDPEGQHLTLVDDGNADFHGEVWDGEDIPLEYAIRGFYGVALSVMNLANMSAILTQVMNFEEIGSYPNPHNNQETITVFAMDGGGPGKEVHVVHQPKTAPAHLGRGGVHHVAFRVTDEAEQRQWEDHLARIGVPTSGQIDRFYFKSLYFRISNGILFELATDGPGFATDESLESLGEGLALPPFLEPRRAQIEAHLKPITAS